MSETSCQRLSGSSHVCCGGRRDSGRSWRCSLVRAPTSLPRTSVCKVCSSTDCAKKGDARQEKGAGVVWEQVWVQGREGSPLQSSCLENPMDGGAWWAAVHGVAKSRTRLSDFTFTFHFHVLEKEMATHSSVLAWRIPGTGKPGGLPSLGSESRTRLKRLSSSSSSVGPGRSAALTERLRRVWRP